MATLEERFWAWVDKTPGQGPKGECWEWRGSRTSTGYGQIKINGSPARAHRVAFYLEHDFWPEVCRHECDNRPCCNPAHLLDGSHASNAQDKVARGRQRTPTGERNGSAKLTRGDACEIRRLYAARCGWTHTKLAKKYGVSPQQIGDIVRGKYWQDG